jgi:DNA-binding XRE family transcriptional regulator
LLPGESALPLEIPEYTSAQEAEMIVTQNQGQYRKPAPDEIGCFIASCRKRLGMKQLALALEVGVDERTIQRIERGEKVNENTLGKIARFLGFDEAAFVAPRYVPTPEEAMEKAREFCAGIIVTEAHDFTAA